MAASVIIDKGLDPLTPGRELPRRKWRALIAERRAYCLENFKTDCRTLLFFVADGRANAFFGYAGEEQYLREGLFLDPDVVTTVAAYLAMHGTGPVSYEQAKDRARKANEIDARDRACPGRQGQRTDLVNNNENDVNEVSRPVGNSSQYAIRRLRKDRPDIHARVLAGELTPHAGMIEAGFRKKRTRKKSTRLDILLRTWKAATKAERDAFLAEISPRKKAA